MSSEGFIGFAGATGAPSVEIDCYTATYRVSGQVATRFTRVGDIVNQAPAAYLVVDHATISEYAAPTATVGAPQALVSIDEILFIVTRGVEATSNPEMRIPKRPVRAQLAVPPFRITGTVHVPAGSRPVDGLLNASDRFLPMTNAEIVCVTVDGLDRTVPAVAVHRRRAHLLLVADDERPDELLADVLDEATAQAWFRREERRVSAPEAAPDPGEQERLATVGQRQLDDLRTIVAARAPHLAGRVDDIGTRTLSPIEMEALRSVVSDELMSVGLDENDELNERGDALSDLIDLLGRM